MKHTLGPWHTIQRNGSLWVYCEDHKDESNPTIADINIMDPNSEANANLIVAAPEMLEALKIAQLLLEELSVEQGFTSQQDDDYKLIKSVINKAEGK